MPIAVTTFSGGGVIDEGIKRAGYDIVLAVEREESLSDVYRVNHGDHIVVDSCENVSFRHLRGQVDLFHASPPCQSYSRARSPNLDPHLDRDAGLMIPRAVYEMRPRVVTIENVRGYLKSPVYAEIKEKLELQGYKLFEKIVNCKHLGVPQNRERLIVVGLLEGSYTFPEDDRIIGWYNVIEDLLNDCPDSHLAPWQIRRLDNVLNNGLVNDDSKQKRPVPFEKPCPTIMTTGSGGNFKALLIDNFNYDLIPDYQHCRTLRASKQGLLRFLSQDTSGIKALTPRCLARLMSLSDDYILPDSKTLATKVIGNGFPPEAMFRILENL